jgi:hypothetical protein
MLVCHGCHRTIDQDKRGTRYSAALLRRWKKEHEERIVIVTGIRPNMKSHVVLYGANIGEEASRLNPREAADALFPHRYPASDRPVALSMQWAGKDADPDYWKNEERNLVSLYDRSLRPILEDAHAQHCSVFALAPMPLLVKLGSLLTDKAQTDVYQLHREPQTWKWLDGPSRFSYRTIQGRPGDGSPVLIISLSDRIAHDRVRASVLDNVAIWELTVAKPGNDFLRSREQLAKFRQAARDVIAEIGRTHGKSAPLRIFPAMPVACAVELGRIRMPKADSNWTIYDYNNAAGRFNPAVVLGAQK